MRQSNNITKFPNVNTLGDAYKQFQPELIFYLIRRFGVPRSEAEDIVQTAFTQLSGQADMENVQNIRAYLYKSCSNQAIDNQRRAKVRDSYRKLVTPINEQVQYEIDPAMAVESKKQLGVIARVMWHMPIKRRKLLMMSRFDGLSYAEISRQVGLSETVVRKHIARALDECTEALNSKVLNSNSALGSSKGDSK